MNEVQYSLARKFEIEGSVETDFRWKLARRINDLIQNDFNKLVRILYQVDVDESKLRNVLQERPGSDAGDLLADLLIEREKQKSAHRSHRSNAKDIPEDEKW